VVIAERRIEQNAARRTAEEALARARWLAGIGEATLTLQHQINNPLTALLTEAQLLAEEPDVQTEHRQRLEMISEQAQRISKVVRRMSRLEDPRTVEYLEGAPMIDLSGDDEG
jgi:signal transduction histidine kinase